MIKVTIGTNTKRQEVILEGTETIRQVLSNQGVDVDRVIVNLDGGALMRSELDQTFQELNVKDDSECMLIASTKQDSAK